MVHYMSLLSIIEMGGWPTQAEWGSQVWNQPRLCGARWCGVGPGCVASHMWYPGQVGLSRCEMGPSRLCGLPGWNHGSFRRLVSTVVMMGLAVLQSQQQIQREDGHCTVAFSLL